MKYRINKKADERLLSFYWIIMFVIVTVAVVSAVLIFVSSPFDIRETESKLLVDSLVKCISENGVLKENFVNLSNEGLERKCNLNLKDNTYYGEESNKQYFVAIRFKEKEYSSGNSNLEALCEGAEQKENIPVCANKKIMLLDSRGEFVLVNLVAAVRKTEKNAIS